MRLFAKNSVSAAAAALLAMSIAASTSAQDGVEVPAAAAEAPAAPAPAAEAPATPAPEVLKEPAAPVAGKPESLEHRVAYFFGTNVGEHLKQNVGLDSIDYDIFLAGLKDSMEGADLKLTEEEMHAAVTEFQEKAAAKAATEREASAGLAAAEGEKFLAENAKREGVKITESGLQYEVLKAAEGDKPAASDTVSVHYQGTLISGKVFDSSYERKEPTEFPVNRVIPGWTEALQLMSVGSKYKLFIPAKLAYGESGAGEDIRPNETLIFEVELLKIVK